MWESTAAVFRFRCVPSVLGRLAGPEKRWDGDGSHKSQDQQNHHEFDEGEPRISLLSMGGIGDLHEVCIVTNASSLGPQEVAQP